MLEVARGAHYHTYCTIVTFATVSQDEVKGSSTVCEKWSSNPDWCQSQDHDYAGH